MKDKTRDPIRITKLWRAAAGVNRPSRLQLPGGRRTDYEVKSTGANRGFTMVELMITMVVFVLFMAGATQMFTGLLTQFKQQSRIAETGLSGVAGLEVMRRDIEHAGYGLPWDLKGATYRELTSESGSTPWVDRDFNDGPDTNPMRGNCPNNACSSQSDECDPGYANGCSSPPAAFRNGDDEGISDSDGTSIIPNSQADVLVIKSANVGMSNASQKWTYMANSGNLPNRLKIWNPDPSDPSVPLDRINDPEDDDQVIVLDPGKGNTRDLENSGGHFYESLGDTSNPFTFGQSGSYAANGFEPDAHTYTQFVVYGIAPADTHGSHIRMPFNRADYFVKKPGTNMPARCAPNTGILYKAVTNNTLNNDGNCPGGGGCMKLYPILDCVADMQVVYLMDNKDQSGNPHSDGIADWCPDSATCPGYVACTSTTTHSPTASPTDDISCLTAAQIRRQVKEVRVYIVAQEGQRDAGYDFSQGGSRTSLSATIVKPDDLTKSLNVGTVNLAGLVGNPEYKYYRWKLYTLVVEPDDMR
ncbi:MAG: prepilin-type N-terminal cleavage/methylation domain-containing protein [Candidatus Sulfobium sp.]|jgi:prepilin-type N-terminal cleavage/methylation domain-containing protein